MQKTGEENGKRHNFRVNEDPNYPGHSNNGSPGL